MLSYLPLRSVDGGGSEQEGVVALSVEGAGGVEDDLLQAAVVGADVGWRSGHGAAAMMAARRQPRLCRRRRRATFTSVKSIKFVQTDLQTRHLHQQKS